MAVLYADELWILLLVLLNDTQFCMWKMAWDLCDGSILNVKIWILNILFIHVFKRHICSNMKHHKLLSYFGYLIWYMEIVFSVSEQNNNGFRDVHLFDAMQFEAGRNLFWTEIFA